MSGPLVIALDGPAGVGKSTVGARLADRLGYFYFDTGALYRAVAARALDFGHDPTDEELLRRIVADLDVVVRPASVDDGRQYDVLLNGSDVSQTVRSAEVDAIVSLVAASPIVRRGLTDAQRRQIRAPGTVMAGRDIGTVICPDADLKVYLEASSTERARRRLRQLGGAAEDFDQILNAIERRDRIDSTRELAPLAVAGDAHVVDTEGRGVDEVVNQILGLVQQRGWTASGAQTGVE